jgi:DNA-binding transcriptional ArsR family regulator
MDAQSEQQVLLEFFKALAEPDRLRIAGRLACGPATVPALAAELEIAPSECARHAGRLAALGLISEDASERPPVYQLDESWLREISRSLLDSPRSRALNGATNERSRVLASFFRDGRLLSIPTGDARKLIVLGEITAKFDAARTYTEREVSAVLKHVYEYDYVTLRRMLVDFCFLNRAGGVYWVGEGRRDPSAAPIPVGQGSSHDVDSTGPEAG